jgi:hypothetical protein
MSTVMPKITLKIASDFSPTPGPRYIVEGDWSGELFRKKVLSPRINEAIRQNSQIEVILDGTAGYGTSFLEEAFGGLVREEKMDYDQIAKCLLITSVEEDYLVTDIMQYLDEANQDIHKV